MEPLNHSRWKQNYFYQVLMTGQVRETGAQTASIVSFSCVIKHSFTHSCTYLSSPNEEYMFDKQGVPKLWCVMVEVSSCEITDEGVAQRLAGFGLKHRVISVRPLVGTLGRSRSNSSAATRSTALYLQWQTAAFTFMWTLRCSYMKSGNG